MFTRPYVMGDIGDAIEDHLGERLGSNYRQVAVTEEKQNSSRACDTFLACVLIFSVILTGALVSYSQRSSKKGRRDD